MYRPLILIGNGCRNNPKLIEHLCSLNIPVCTTWMGADLVPEDSPVFVGRPGIFGQRCANICQQKADYLYCFGARLDGEQVAYDYERFAPHATKYIYDVDDSELSKYPPDWQTGWFKKGDPMTWYPSGPPKWLAWCKALYLRFTEELQGNESSKYVSPFALMRYLSDAGKPDDVFAIGSSGNAPTAFYQSFRVKAGQRIHNVCTTGAMGADIPMALGSALASGRRTICVTGDGGFNLNAQELETIRREHLPITFFVLNNNGYASIRTMQDVRFEGRHMGCDPKSGLTLPALEDLAGAYRLTYTQLWGADLKDFSKCFDFAPRIVEVMVDPEWKQLPRVMASTVDGQLRTDSMEDMSPRVADLRNIMDWDG